MNRILSLLGLCMKAGLLVAGELAVENAIKGDKAKLVILSTDASANTQKKFVNSTTFYNVKLVRYGIKEELGYALGKADRSVIGICDDGFAKKLEALIEAENLI